MDYEDFRRKAVSRIEERPEWKNLATFIPNKRLPIYNWFYYKEGFSRDFVFETVASLGINKGAVLDPFCGCGTTLLACREMGISSVGIDSLPVAAFASRAKTNYYDVKELQGAARSLFAEKFERVDSGFDSLLRRAFSGHALQDIAFFRDRIADMEPAARDFFLLALVKAAMLCSYARKDGSVIKFRKRPVPPLNKMYRRVVKRMISDVKRFRAKPCATAVSEGDSRMLKLEDSSVDFVITSPPYLNQINYGGVYALESSIAGLPASGMHLRSSPVRQEDSFKDIKMPAQAVAYFIDMERVLSEMCRVAKDKARLAIVIGNGYAGEIIESDIIIAYVAEEIGLDTEKILVLNKRFALEDRSKKRGTLRESLLLLRKGGE